MKFLTLPVLLALVALPVWADPTPATPGPAPVGRPQAIMDTADHSGGWVGKTAQPFTKTDSDGKTVDLSKVFGTRPVVLIFYRGVWCPYCHSQMADLSRHQAEFQRAGAAVYAISNEDAPNLKQMQSNEHLGFVMFLSDPDGSAARLYAGLYPGSMVHQPGSFVIDKHRKITYAYVNQDYHSRAATTSLLAAVRKSR
ncbi:MAG: peroxiredoxin family protein [Armatimonadota bacterium]|nr:peroxiredoxin family protein [Armatimonadota bacterium]